MFIGNQAIESTEYPLVDPTKKYIDAQNKQLEQTYIDDFPEKPSPKPPKQTLPKQTTPKSPKPPKQTTPKQTTPKQTTPKQTTPKSEGNYSNYSNYGNYSDKYDDNCEKSYSKPSKSKTIEKPDSKVKKDYKDLFYSIDDDIDESESKYKSFDNLKINVPKKRGRPKKV
jgi:hypothetical protein